ncbi:MAG: VWA domain-containing protein [Oscillospiraceae bacterium]|nr:VWA domain-containing protein [Oscillospiraceae bacterium]
MKRTICFLLLLTMLTGLLLGGLPGAEAAAAKAATPRTIGIVFDNSGSMYIGRKTEWSRATYAMEVFASMLNEGDSLRIYPMHGITVDETPYDMNDPLVLTGPEQAEKIRRIFTPNALGTPIEAVEQGYADMKNQSGERWLIVLTDGDVFDRNKNTLGDSSMTELKQVLEAASADMNVLYLGIGANALVPNCTAQGQHKLVAEKASRSEDVLKYLTNMCNTIFGRDTMGENHFKNDALDFDVSLSKMIVFVQGESISDVRVIDAAGNEVGQKVSEIATMYSTLGAERPDDRNNPPESLRVPDTSLQGMMVTYTGCPAGSYSLSYSGNATSKEIYYEPDVDIVFTFTDAAGNSVDPDTLYEADYKLSYGMMDAQTGAYTESDLLGDTSYTGHYYIDGQAYEISSSDKSGSVDIHLDMGSSFDADMAVRYLSGYEIYKDGRAFGWPEGGIRVQPRPAGALELVISGGTAVYELSELEQAPPWKAEVYYQGEKLTGAELEKVEITWDPELSGALLLKDFQEDHYDIYAFHKNPDAPEETPLGTFSFPMTALYTPQGSEEASSPAVEFTYSIEDNTGGLAVKLTATQDYYVLSDLSEGDPIRADLTLEGQPLSAEEFAAINFTAKASGLSLRTEPLPEDSAYLIYIDAEPKPAEGDYEITGEVSMSDNIGRVYSHRDRVNVTMSVMAMWLKWLLAFLALVLLVIIIILICRIKALPKHLHITKRNSELYVDGDNVTPNASFDAGLGKGRVDIFTKYAGKKFGLTMNVKPAKGSYLCTAQAKRVASVDSASVKKQGAAIIQEATIGSVKYVYDEDTKKFERSPKSDKPFLLKNGTRVAYSGIITTNGEAKSFNVATKLNFKKKK